MTALDATMIGTGLFAIAILWTAIRSKPRTSIDSPDGAQQQREADGAIGGGGGAFEIPHSMEIDRARQ